MFKYARGVGKGGQEKDLTWSCDFQMYSSLYIPVLNCCREQRLHTVSHCEKDNEDSGEKSITPKMV